MDKQKKGVRLEHISKIYTDCLLYTSYTRGTFLIDALYVLVGVIMAVVFFMI